MTGTTTSAPPDGPEGPDLSHHWVGAALVDLTLKKARRANKYQSYRADEHEMIRVLETYCDNCRRPYDEVADQVCAAKINNEHLIGGDQSTRKKRIHHPLPPGARIIPGAPINRFGIDAVIRGEL